MAQYSRGSVLVGNGAKLGIQFTVNDVLTDVYDLVGVKILPPGGTQSDYIQSYKTSTGIYYVDILASMIQVEGTYYDTWYYLLEEGGDLFSIQQSFYADLLPESASLLALIKFLRIILGDNNPMRYRRNPHMDGVAAYATTPNLDPYGFSYKWSNEELESYLYLSLNYINSTWGMHKSWTYGSCPNSFLMIRGAEILAIKSKGYTELNESFELSDGGASLQLARHQNWLQQAQTLEQQWSEEVKMFKYKFRPRPIGVGTVGFYFGGTSLLQELPSYFKVYGRSYLGYSYMGGAYSCR